MKFEKLKSTTRCSQTSTYHLTFKPYGWATFYIDDEHGTLAIVSDWGNRSYRWGRGEWLGVSPPDLSRALVRFARSSDGSVSCDYIARKLFPYDEQQAHDPTATEREFRQQLIEQRKHGELSRDDARRLWNDLDEIDWESPDLIIQGLAGEQHWEEPWNYLQTSPTWTFLFFRDELLPTFITELEKLTEAQAPAAAAK